MGAKSIAEEHELKQGVCAKIMDSLAAIAATEVKKTGKFVVPGVAMLKTRMKPATKAGKREVFGKEVMVKAKPARSVVKAFPVSPSRSPSRALLVLRVFEIQSCCWP